MQFNRKDYSDDTLLTLYKSLLRSRLTEEKMLILLRQGKLSKWFSGIGQEAISAGIINALDHDEWVLPLHRNLAVFTDRGMPLEKLLAQWQGKPGGFTKGRDRSFHFGSKEHHIFGMISHLGASLPVANGIALGNLLGREAKVVVAFCGEGMSSEGDFHEALNVAAVWNLPVIFVIENNGYALSTPVNEQYNCYSLVDKAPGYGMDALQIDGNNILEVYDTFHELTKDVRSNPRPVLIEALTFRMRGHEEASGTKYVPQEMFDYWKTKDPVDTFKAYLIDNEILNETEEQKLRESYQKDINKAVKSAEKQKAYSDSEPEDEVQDLFHPYDKAPRAPAKSSKKPQKRFIDAISESLDKNLRARRHLLLMGQDIAEYGGVFKVTEGLAEKHGKERVRNTPLCESAIVGMGPGLTVKGYKAVIEMQFADFVSCAFNQIVNNLAKTHYRWGQHTDVVIRMPTGAGTGAGPFHSQSTEALFFHIPGLKIVYPSNPYDAKGLLNRAIDDPNPVLYFEHKALYRNIKDNVSASPYTIEIGEGRIVREGKTLSVITYGMGVHWAREIIEQEELDAEILDLRSLSPWDKDKVRQTVEKTGKVILLTEDTLTGSIISEIAAWINENCFEWLDAPVMREASLDTPVPFARSLEDNFLPKARFKQRLLDLNAY